MTMENKSGTSGNAFGNGIITADEAASLSRLCGRTIRKMCERGEIQAVKVCGRWLINRDSFLRLIGLDVA